MPATRPSRLTELRLSLFAFGMVAFPASPSMAQPLASVHPGYDLVDIRPADFEPQVTGMQLLPDGRLLVLTHKPVYDKPVVPGALYVVSGIGGKSSAGVTVRKIAGNVFCGTGLLAQDGRVFITEKNRLVEILDLEGQVIMDSTVANVPGKYRTIHKYGWDGNFHQYAFGPLYRKEADGKGYFYVALSTAWKETLNKSRNRASLIKISESTGGEEIVLSGIRTLNGIGFGPGGEIFGADNQGGWLPSSKLINLRPGRFYGFPNNAGGAFDSLPPSPPAIWMPHGAISESPSDPAYIEAGPYEGQFLIGDMRFGGIQRCFLEKVNGEYQGAIFKFSGGLETGINRIAMGPDGVVYLGGIGAEASGFWSWPAAKGPRFWGLNKLVPNHKPNFDFLSVRSMGPDKLELQFTEPVLGSAASPADFEVKSWSYRPTADYGCCALPTAIHTVTAAIPTASGDGILLSINGLKAGTVVSVKVRNIAAKSGRPLWTDMAWYTLNQIGPGQPVGLVRAPSLPGRASVRPSGFRIRTWDSRGIRLETGIKGEWEIALLDFSGKELCRFRGKGPLASLDLPGSAYPSGIYWLAVETSAHRFAARAVHASF